jgi:hypothetical protein
VGKLIIAAVVCGGLIGGYLWHARSKARLEAARESTRSTCLAAGNEAAACECVATNEWNSETVSQFLKVLEGKEQASMAFIYNKRHAELLCAEQAATDPRVRVAQLLTRECVEQLRSEFAENTLSFCLCVARELTTDRFTGADVVVALSGGDDVKRVVERNRIGAGGLKEPEAQRRCSKYR